MKYIFKNRFLRKWEKDKIPNLTYIPSKAITPKFLEELIAKMPFSLYELKQHYRKIREIISDSQIDALQDNFENYIFIPLSYLNKAEILKSIYANRNNLEIFKNDNILSAEELKMLS
ncbi:hypothetical protein [Metamycoplasma neophronis]|uniref:Uncharacterized protein n=1 Tax=Metamycoplasma neophronis TaxID=872983 RepID=A0ABY2Z192_9BACT|nr:hypothetical protein [Metamycoplasma neophronis]TPR53199.1 hypothetical protein FJR74_03035 [Metamycoplasma neophronis]